MSTFVSRRTCWIPAIAALAFGILAARSAFAQGQSRITLAEARLVVGAHGSGLFRGAGFDTIDGNLVIDSAGRQMRFEAAGAVRLAVSYDAIRALRFEVSRFPQRAFRRSTTFLTVFHDAGPSGISTAIVRLPGNARDRLDEIERATGVRIDRAPSKESFLGLPVHTTPGTRVIVKETSGRKISGRVTGLSMTTLSLDGRPIEAREIVSVHAPDTLVDGVASGATIGIVFGAFLRMGPCLTGGHGCGAGPFYGSFAAGTALGWAIDYASRRRAYSSGGATSRTSVAPIVGPASVGVRVSFSVAQRR
jgi:hypothetical protein